MSIEELRELAKRAILSLTEEEIQKLTAMWEQENQMEGKQQ